jgi:ABC-type amino acid transport substrate-binding protein
VIDLKILPAALAASLLLAFASPALANRLEEIKARGKLLVGVSETTPPFSFRKSADGSPAGITAGD